MGRPGSTAGLASKEAGGRERGLARKPGAPLPAEEDVPGAFTKSGWNSIWDGVLGGGWRRGLRRGLGGGSAEGVGTNARFESALVMHVHLQLLSCHSCPALPGRFTYRGGNKRRLRTLNLGGTELRSESRAVCAIDPQLPPSPGWDGFALGWG